MSNLSLTNFIVNEQPVEAQNLFNGGGDSYPVLAFGEARSNVRDSRPILCRVEYGMANEPITTPNSSPVLHTAQVYGMAFICLLAGLAMGFLLHGAQPPVSPAQSAAVVLPQSPPVGTQDSAHMPRQMPSLDQMKRMADTQASPLLEKLKRDPNNNALLAQVGAIYHTTHQFKEAAAYYGKAAQADPRNVALRTKLASSLYRSGDVDGAIAQLNKALAVDPKDANALFDLGMIKLQGKKDGKGALAAWQTLLKTNPQLSADRKAMVLKLMADVMTTMGEHHAIEGLKSNDGHNSNSN
jgi:cytochrome c-type biogenesis protein CcmH/NrfG